MKSAKPNKQRKARYQAPLHGKRKLLGAHLAKNLREQWNKRSITLRKGDEVKVMRGKFAGENGKISKIDLKRTKIYIDSIKRKKVSGEEVHIPLSPSNILITNPVMDDPKRKKVVQRTIKKEKVE
ncbi:MAG: 50S ribosomal protein L24 [Candidatus Aenigmarchaeota archaeon]|nr:50S ribosomal protein L24 [Candidatus Aenigmarchaeota archaeon]